MHDPGAPALPAAVVAQLGSTHGMQERIAVPSTQRTDGCLLCVWGFVIRSDTLPVTTHHHPPLQPAQQTGPLLYS